MAGSRHRVQEEGCWKHANSPAHPTKQYDSFTPQVDRGTGVCESYVLKQSGSRSLFRPSDELQQADWDFGKPVTGMETMRDKSSLTFNRDQIHISFTEVY
jgi:hypothetical protein